MKPILRHREPPLGGAAIQSGSNRLLALDGHVASLPAMTMMAPESFSNESGC